SYEKQQTVTKVIPLPPPPLPHDFYLRYLPAECQLSERTLHRASIRIASVLESMGAKAQRRRFKTLKAEIKRQEVQRIFAQINAQTALGRRDDALLRLLYSRFHE
ncbi:MAG: hypothetical protein KIT22_10970, partial [Verrucomicrobiae bacterium]|nr:hypothetical protein [Verrucomicrobiae bacterium]